MGYVFYYIQGLNFIFNKSNLVREILSYLTLILNFYLNVGLCIHTVPKNGEVSLNETAHTPALWKEMSNSREN